MTPIINGFDFPLPDNKGTIEFHFLSRGKDPGERTAAMQQLSSCLDGEGLALLKKLFQVQSQLHKKASPKKLPISVFITRNKKEADLAHPGNRTILIQPDSKRIDIIDELRRCVEETEDAIIKKGMNIQRSVVTKKRLSQLTHA